MHNTRYSNMSCIQNTINSSMSDIHTTSYKSFYIKNTSESGVFPYKVPTSL